MASIIPVAHLVVGVRTVSCPKSVELSRRSRGRRSQGRTYTFHKRPCLLPKVGEARVGPTHFRLIRFLRTSVVTQRPPTGGAVPGPGPQTQRIAFGNPTWHFSPYAGSMVVRKPRRIRRLSPMMGSGEHRANAGTSRRGFARRFPSASCNFMLLAQRDKCRGAGAAPQHTRKHARTG